MPRTSRCNYLYANPRPWQCYITKEKEENDIVGRANAVALPQNSQSFEGVQIQSFQTSAPVSSLLKYFRENSRSTAPKVIGELLIDKCRCWSFFDGARQGPDQASGIGGILYFSDVYYISYKANCSQGTNNLAVLAWRTLLKLALDEGLCDLHVYGYSSSVVNWMLGTQALNNTSLQNIGSHVKEIAGAFDTLQDRPCFSQIRSNCRHTFKEGIHLRPGTIHFQNFEGANQESRYILDFR